MNSYRSLATLHLIGQVIFHFFREHNCCIFKKCSNSSSKLEATASICLPDLDVGLKAAIPKPLFLALSFLQVSLLELLPNYLCVSDMDGPRDWRPFLERSLESEVVISLPPVFTISFFPVYFSVCTLVFELLFTRLSVKITHSCFRV